MDEACLVGSIRAMHRSLFLSASLFLVGFSLPAQEVTKLEPPAEPVTSKAEGTKTEEPKDAPKEEKKEEKKDEKADKKTQTKHSITIAGRKIDFTATAGTLALKDAEGKTTADIFYIAYTKKGRPMWLHVR